MRSGQMIDRRVSSRPLTGKSKSESTALNCDCKSTSSNKLIQSG